MKRLKIIVLLAILLFVSFSVSSNAQECQRARPVVTVSPTSVTGPSDTTFFLTLTIKNEDTQTCGASTFVISPSLPANWESFVKPGGIGIFPSQSALFSVDIIVPKDAAKDTYQVNFVVSTQAHQNAGVGGFGEAKITIRDEPKTCSITIDSIVLRKAATDVEKTTYCLKEKVDVDTKISLKGNTEAQVFADLFIDGKLLDSSIVNIEPDNFATINFKNSIDTTSFGKATPNLKIVAKAACASSEATKEKQFTIDICDPSCLFTASIAAPLEKEVGRDIITSIYTRNIGNKENLIAIEQAVCREGTCIPMVCEISSVKLQSDESKSYSCRQQVRSTGTHAIETKIFACGKEEAQTKEFFAVASTTQPATPSVSEGCKVEPLAEFRCSGSIRQQLFRNSDCSTTWAYSQYCPDGCSKGLCISSGEDVRGFEPVVELEGEFEGKSGGDALLAFDIENTINSPAKFDIKISGKAAEWISVPSSVIVGEKAQEKITFSASIPDDVEPGDYDFTVTVSTGNRVVSKSSLISIAEEEQPGVSIEVVFGIIGGLLAVFVLLSFLQSKYGKRESF
ncbi:MAG: hypothetical protein HY361_04485 [Candidatus Aenigmarchaeota archaeon]|nr:hypothetical protein [Candidatus Aenigmarchaeota archaeon]